MSWISWIGTVISRRSCWKLLIKNIRQSNHKDRALRPSVRKADQSLPGHRDYLEQLESSSSHLDSLLLDTTSTINLLSSLTASFKTVEAQTTAFQKQCEDLLKEQKRMTELADDMGQNLKYYSYLEPITRRLNAPGAGSYVRSKEFSNMLTRLDECLDYMTTHVGISSVPTSCADRRIAKPTGSKYIPFSISLADDSRIDLDSKSFRRRFTRHCFGCHTKDR